jgi:hypothetical protein
VEIAEVQDKNLQTTEFLNHELPDAHIKGGDGIGGKYENMTKSSTESIDGIFYTKRIKNNYWFFEEKE